MARPRPRFKQIGPDPWGRLDRPALTTCTTAELPASEEDRERFRQVAPDLWVKPERGLYTTAELPPDAERVPYTPPRARPRFVQVDRNHRVRADLTPAETEQALRELAMWRCELLAMERSGKGVTRFPGGVTVTVVSIAAYRRNLANLRRSFARRVKVRHVCARVAAGVLRQRQARCRRPRPACRSAVRPRAPDDSGDDCGDPDPHRVDHPSGREPHCGLNPCRRRP